jgi:hypothetical protein
VDEAGYLSLGGCVLALALAVCTGFGVGRSVPGWQIDRYNEDGQHHGSSLFSQRDFSSAFPTSCLLGSGIGTGACAIAAYLLWLLCWPHNTDDGEGLVYFLEPGVWALLGSAAVGYVAAILSDRGPVGPLE